jgi:hypothetical protein
VEHLLTQLPFDLCVTCHAVDGMKDAQGLVLANFKRWLDENKVWQAPVAAKGRCAQAVKAYREALRLQPGHQGALEGLRRCGAAAPARPGDQPAPAR